MHGFKRTLKREQHTMKYFVLAPRMVDVTVV